MMIRQFRHFIKDFDFMKGTQRIEADWLNRKLSFRSDIYCLWSRRVTGTFAYFWLFLSHPAVI